MKFLKAFVQNKIAFGVALLAAVCIMAFSGVQTSRAALSYISENYTAQVTVSDIGVTLMENGKDISFRNYTENGVWSEQSGELLNGLIPDGEQFRFEYPYPEELTVRNTGAIEEYVRVVLTRYWVGPDGKDTALAPELIKVQLTDSAWIVDEGSSTAERMVLYYPVPLGVGETAPALSSGVSIDGSLASKVTEHRETNDQGYTIVTTTFDYNGVEFVLEAEVDAVQTHNAAEAIKSAWGVDVTVDAAGNLSLR